MIRLLGYFFSIGVVLFLLVAGGVAMYVGDMAKDLPSLQKLTEYEPKVATRVHAADGRLMAEYARERRLFLPIQAVPDLVKAAFLSAEDKNFYQHPGIDPQGLFRAVATNLKNMGAGRKPVGASTITQQVAKNFLLTSDQTYERKIKEAILSFRIEQAMSKDKILELYLNEIFLGLGAYGIAGAALTYFDKSVNELTLEEAAYLAALPKAPSNYHPYKDTDAAIERRNWVIDRMVENKYVAFQDGEAAKAKPLGVNPRKSGTFLFAAEYFTEEVRREIIARYGENALYEGGLSVRATLDPNMQEIARDALHKGMEKYDLQQGYRGPIGQIDVSGDWGVPLGKFDVYADLPEWRAAVVLSADDNSAEVGLRPETGVSGKLDDKRETAVLSASGMKWAFRVLREDKRVSVKKVSDFLTPGDVVYVEQTSDGWRLRQVAEVSGGLGGTDPHTRPVLAIVGGFSFSQSEFNRATQAYRQPGSSFKPFVYAAALDNGYTPASVVLDAPIQIVSGGELWEPKNYGGGAAGPSTLRLGIERSRNLMTVRLAKDMGMKLVAEYAEQFGVYDKMLPVLAMSLGSGETTVMRMVSAYSVFANGGKQIKPSIIDRIQDRYGKTIYKHDGRTCQECQATAWLNQPEPELIDNREQVLDPMTAYQITSMMEGVVQRGTAEILKALERPIAGKTGTTNEEKDAWFVGYTPSLVVGVYMGFDTPRPMGKGMTGGGLAAPVFQNFMEEAMKGVPPVEFKVPEGMTLIAINRKTGMKSSGKGPDVIDEAFKPGTGPADSYSVIGNETVSAVQQKPRAAPSQRAKQAISEGRGGLF